MAVAYLLLGQNVGAIEIRLDRNHGPMEGLDIRDQGKYGTCYAYAAAQMIDAYRLTHGMATQQKALSVAHLSIFSDFLSTPMILHSASNKSICTDERMRAFLGNKSDGEFTNFVHMLVNMHKIWERTAGYFESRSLPAPPDDTVLAIDQFLATRLDEQSRLSLQKDITNKMGWLRALWAAEILPAICGQDSINIGELPETDWVSVDVIAKVLKEKNGSRQLSKKIAGYFSSPQSQPVGIGFCANIIKGEPTFRLFPRSNTTCQHHAAILIGVRDNAQNGHDFLMRNSWGPSWCPPEAPGLECDGVGGQVWISDRILLKALEQITVWKYPTTG